MLSRKVEGIDPVKPWQPPALRKGAKFYSYFGKDNMNSNFLGGIFSFILKLKYAEPPPFKGF